MVASGGDWRAGVTGALTAAAFFAVGTYFQGVEAANGGTLSGGARVSKVIAHGTVGGASSAAQGGRFKDGFLSAGAADVLAPGIGSINGDGIAASIGGCNEFCVLSHDHIPRRETWQDAGSPIHRFPMN